MKPRAAERGRALSDARREARRRLFYLTTVIVCNGAVRVEPHRLRVSRGALQSTRSNFRAGGIEIGRKKGVGKLSCCAADRCACEPLAHSDDAIDRGRYMIVTGLFAATATLRAMRRKRGAVPEKEWLTGSGPLGYRGPWGTNYPSNLRLTVASTERRRLGTLTARPSGPPADALLVGQRDLRVGPAGDVSLHPRASAEPGAPVRPSLPPGEEPKGPFILWPSPPK